MGRWNETCILSNLPILHEQQIVLFFLTKNKNYNYSGYYNVKFLPLFGEYNDYGGIKNIKKTESYKFLMNHENWNDNKEINDAIHDNEKYNRVSFMHRDIYNSILQNMENRKPYKNKNKIKILFNTKIHKFLYEFDTCHNKIIAESIFKTDIESLFGLDCYELIMTEYPEKNQEKLIDEIVELTIIKWAMSHARINFSNCVGRGSQSIETRIQSIIAEKILEKRHDVIHENKILDDRNKATEEIIWWE